MESIKELLKAGPGPSSSHTIGPMKASLAFLQRAPQAAAYSVELWGSLAATGKGHLTDYIIDKTFKEAGKTVRIEFKAEYTHSFHPNGMRFHAFDSQGQESAVWTVFSIGGGALLEEGQERRESGQAYPFQTFKEMLAFCDKEGYGRDLWKVALHFEGQEIFKYLHEIWTVMKNAIYRGLAGEGVLPGGIGCRRRAKEFWESRTNLPEQERSLKELFAYALAASEENASGAEVVTAPTCGAAGVIPGLFYFLQQTRIFSDDDMVKALACAALVGVTVKSNASVSGAEAGCQAEVGTACSMAALGAAWLLGGSLEQMEYAAEIAMEHHLGLTCDPVAGLVQIPCIERNAMGARRALDSAYYALFTNGSHRVNFDTVVAVMYETGINLKSEYKETAQGGLARFYMEGS